MTANPSGKIDPTGGAAVNKLRILDLFSGIGGHSLDRMEERGITTLDALRVLRGGDIKGMIEPGKNSGEWKCKIAKTMKGSRESCDARHELRSPLCEDCRMGRFEMSETFYLTSEEVRKEPVLYRACGLDQIYLLNGYDLEDHDGEQHMSVQKMEELHQAIGRHLVTHRKGLVPKEIRFLRNTMDLTQAELAARLGNNAQSVARWEKGECEVPGASEKLLRVVFLASLFTDAEMSALKEFLNSSLSALDELDETVPAQGRFELGDIWHEKPVAQRELAYA